MTVKSIYILYFFVLLIVSIVTFPDGFIGAGISALIAVLVIFILRNNESAEDLIKIFLIALIFRTLVSSSIYFFQLTNFFALDWNLYDKIGIELANYWAGRDVLSPLAQVYTRPGETAWGMVTLVGIIYSVTGQNVLAAQLVMVSIGAATAPVSYLCAFQIYNNRRVALISGYIIALMPSLVLWSSLLLKDGLIIFLLVLTIYCAIKLQEKVDYLHIFLLLLSLAGIMALRFYIFYIVSVAIVGGFVIGQKNNITSIIGRGVVIVVLGIGLGYVGLLNNSSRQIEEITSLERIQTSREDLAKSAASGFGEDLNVSTTEGALVALPIGLTYLMLAPFPWQITSNLSLMTMPEMFVWWLSMPLLFSGVIYSVRHRLRRCLSMLVFTIMLMIGYSILQGNVGTAYRHRAQIQVFLFIFIAVGWSLWQERKENRQMTETVRQQKLRQKLQSKV